MCGTFTPNQDRGQSIPCTLPTVQSWCRLGAWLRVRTQCHTPPVQQVWLASGGRLIELLSMVIIPRILHSDQSQLLFRHRLVTQSSVEQRATCIQHHSWEGSDWAPLGSRRAYSRYSHTCQQQCITKHLIGGLQGRKPYYPRTDRVIPREQCDCRDSEQAPSRSRPPSTAMLQNQWSKARSLQEVQLALMMTMALWHRLLEVPRTSTIQMRRAKPHLVDLTSGLWLLKGFCVLTHQRRSKSERGQSATIPVLPVAGSCRIWSQRKYSVQGDGRAYNQKHHLHVTLSVKAPPTTGPMLEKRPNKLTTIPRNKGRSWRVQTYVRIPKAPWSNPGAPRPAIALPVMKTGELGAEAQTMEPTSKIAM